MEKDEKEDALPSDGRGALVGVLVCSGGGVLVGVLW